MVDSITEGWGSMARNQSLIKKKKYGSPNPTKRLDLRMTLVMILVAPAGMTALMAEVTAQL